MRDKLPAFAPMSLAVLMLALLAAACNSTPSQPGDSAATTDPKAGLAAGTGQGTGAAGDSSGAGDSAGAGTGDAADPGASTPTGEAVIPAPGPPQPVGGSGNLPDPAERDRILDQVNRGPGIGGGPGSGEPAEPGSETEKGDDGD